MQAGHVSDLAERPDKLPLKIKLGFGVGDVGGNLFVTVVGFYLQFYLTDSFGLAAGLAGTAVFIGLIWDAVTDPAVGYLSDRTSTRWGRRRPYMAVGAVFLFVFMILMFSSPNITSQPGKFAWVVVIYCLLNTAYTLVNIPYSSLTPELTGDFDEQTTLNGFRMSFAIVGTLIGAGTFLVIVNALGGGRMAWMISGGIMGAVMALVTFITIFVVKEQLGAPVKQTISVFKSYMEVIRFKSFVTLFLPYACHMAGTLLIQANLIYYFKYIYKAEEQFQIALIILLVVALAFIPIWVAISRRIGKKLSYNLGMGIFVFALLGYFFAAPLMPFWFVFVVFIVAGIGFSTNYVMPYALMPDVVEADFAETGNRREGVFYGLFTFSSKLGRALAMGISGWVLAGLGYIESTDAAPVLEQSESALLAIRLLTGPIPAAFCIVGIVILSFYPITREAFADIMKRVEAREASAASAEE